MQRLRIFARATALVIALTATAFAGGPRWSSGKPYFTNSDGKPVVWFTTSPLYFTDPGDLSASVNHAAADAMVADAASTWNISISSIVLAQGGSLDEHVSGANVYLGSSGLVFPTDVRAANYAAKQIAVLYDSDGSVTDLLLGSGASDPENCRTAAVTESVDGITPSYSITHALLVLNGRCTGSDPQLQLEMKYRLIRAFGRVLGLAWSQTNDNVFTGSPQASNVQGLNWPLMHPIDVLCGPYAYQCLQQPFTLRPDDMASIATVYPSGATANGKVPTYSLGGFVSGNINFANGQGMQGVNVLVRRYHPATNMTDPYDVASSVSGYRFQRIGGNPVTPKGTSLAVSFGWPYQMEGTFDLGWIPVPIGEAWNNMILTTQPINPLYTGSYAVGPYTGSQVTPSGGTLTLTATVIGRGSYVSKTLVATNGAGPCTATADGTETAPLDVVPNGEWPGTLCGYGHTAWSGLTVKAGRTFTVEVMAQDEQGIPTTGKVMPVVGLWASTDATGTLPTVGSVAFSMNTATLGLTAVTAANQTTRRLRLGLGDMRGDGRPDYAYAARVLYADSIAPTSVAANGGQIVLSGMGFRPGNTVTVNGVAAQVLSWSPTMIVAVAPAQTGSVTSDVTVTDLSTGGQTTMTAALTYGQTALPDLLSVVSAPANGAYVGVPAPTGFGVRVLLADGVTPASNAGVTVTATGATFAACAGATTCVLTTDATGQILTPVTPVAVGTVTLLAAVDAATVAATFTTATILPDTLQLVSAPSGAVYAGVPATIPFAVRVTLPDGVTAVAGLSVAVSATGATLGACAATATCSLVTDATGRVATTVTPTAAGTVSLQASAAGGTVSATFNALAIPPDVLLLTSLPANGSYAGTPASAPFAVQALLGDAITPASAAVIKVTASQGILGACGASTCNLTADASGAISTTVTPVTPGAVALSATTGGSTLFATFTAQAVPPDAIRLVSIPGNGASVGTPTAVPFAFQVFLGDGVTPASGVSATVSATGGQLTACHATTCNLTADPHGLVSTTVTPSLLGTISLTASAGGGSIAVAFTSSADQIRILTQPTTSVYTGVPAAKPFSAQVLLADGVTPAAGVAVNLSATLVGLSTCAGASTCVLTADANGTISAIVTPRSAGVVTFQLSAGGGSASASFQALAMPPDYVKILSTPAGSAYVGLLSPTPFTVQVYLGDRITLATGIAVKLQSPAAGLTNCGTACYFTTDANGTISTTVTPLFAGPIVLTAIAGGVTVTSSFTGVTLPPDVLTVTSLPPDGSPVRQTASAPFSVKILYGDGATIAAGVAMTVTALNGTLTACYQATCVLHADSTGVASTQVIPTASGPVTLTATAGGTTITSAFFAGTPDVLTVLSLPANGSKATQPASIPFKVKAVLPGGTTPAALAPITLTATNATLGACGARTCVLTADASGLVQTTVTPIAAGPVMLTASAGGGTVTASFTAAPAFVADTLRLVSLPANGAFPGTAASTPFSVQAMLGDGTGPDAGANVTLAAIGATFGVCGLSTCVVKADATGFVSSAVTPTQTGVVTLAASAGGGVLTATFRAAASSPDILEILSVPASGSPPGAAAATLFAVKVLLGDGVTPASGVSVTVTAVGAALGACGSATCILAADASGRIATPVTPTAPGVVTLTASAGGGTITASFSAAPSPDVIHVVSEPSNGSFVGRAAATSFAVHVFRADGTTAAPGAVVTLTAAGATLGACGLPSCLLIADASAMVSTPVTPVTAGVVTLTASAGGGTISAFFVAAAPPPDTLQLVSAPTGTVYTGKVASIPFAVRVMLADGTAGAGVPVSLSASAANFQACGAPVCTITSDASGLVSTGITPTLAGTVILSAVAGGGSTSAAFTAIDPIRLLSIDRPIEYLAPGATVGWSLQVTATENGLPASSLAVDWTALSGLVRLSAPESIADSTGTASIGAVVGPLAPGEAASGQACVWTTVCATFAARTVDPSQWRFVVVSGGSQTLEASDTLQPVILRVVDGEGHWIAGVSVALHQVMDAWVACPENGRCPIAPLLGSTSAMLLSDPDGLVTVTPMDLPGVAEVTHVAVAAGTNGFLSLQLSKMP